MKNASEFVADDDGVFAMMFDFDIGPCIGVEVENDASLELDMVAPWEPDGLIF
jgi:hypothetical protein